MYELSSCTSDADAIFENLKLVLMLVDEASVKACYHPQDVFVTPCVRTKG